ncbi:hypothetical protein BGZ61DRAFT_559017 [Ilyonectria robusta]|uniref:uncharacterized protein n=1 Tax=Ilyonectria robusta TaxID=1079257 RepID=UPI001E8CAAF3|nr:uncharacterized protein BGZ61DRAFT_559017 [Ilyonectria robusta]KAH8666176.1 hypothetical protein BGZ61DRAFT_559017 [Ilyonectria robusta]
MALFNVNRKHHNHPVLGLQYSLLHLLTLMFCYIFAAPPTTRRSKTVTRIAIFPCGSCTNVAACIPMHPAEVPREISVLVRSCPIPSSGRAWDARPDTCLAFDAEAACGITLTISSTPLGDATSTATNDSKSSVVSASTSAASAGNSETSSTGSEIRSGESTNSDR